MTIHFKLRYNRKKSPNPSKNTTATHSLALVGCKVQVVHYGGQCGKVKAVAFKPRVKCYISHVKLSQKQKNIYVLCEIDTIHVENVTMLSLV